MPPISDNPLCLHNTSKMIKRELFFFDVYVPSFVFTRTAKIGNANQLFMIDILSHVYAMSYITIVTRWARLIREDEVSWNQLLITNIFSYIWKVNVWIPSLDYRISVVLCWNDDFFLKVYICFSLVDIFAGEEDLDEELKWMG